MLRRPVTPRYLGVGLVVWFLAAACSSGAKNSTTKPSDQPVAPPIPVTLTDTGCVPTSFSLHPGIATFRVTNPGSKKVTEMEVQDNNGHVRADVEGVTAGHTRSFIVDLKIGTYRVRCPETAPTGGTITVT